MLGKKVARTILQDGYCVPLAAASRVKYSAPGQRARVTLVHDAEGAQCSLASTLLKGYESVLSEAVSTSLEKGGASLCYSSLTFDAATFIEDLARSAPPPVPPVEKKEKKSRTERKKDQRREGEEPQGKSNQELQPAHEMETELQPREQSTVVLIQSTAFQNDLKAYRLRLRLQQLGYRVLEHSHLKTMSGTSTADTELEQTYLQACSYSPLQALADGNKWRSACEQWCSLKPSPSEAPHPLILHTEGGHELTFGRGLEPVVLNTGHHTLVESIEKQEATGELPSHAVGCTYPIGEAITESTLLDCVSGSATCFGYPTPQRSLETIYQLDSVSPEPFVLHLSKGVIHDVTGPRIPENFLRLLEMVREEEGDAVIRELGLGLNPFLGRRRTLPDVSSFERQFGVHVSMGKRHPLFIKKSHEELGLGAGGVAPLKRKEGKYHFDLFLCAEKIVVGNKFKQQYIT